MSISAAKIVDNKLPKETMEMAAEVNNTENAANAEDKITTFLLVVIFLRTRAHSFLGVMPHNRSGNVLLDGESLR